MGPVAPLCNEAAGTPIPGGFRTAADQAKLSIVLRLLRSTPPIRPKPPSIIAQLAGSGAALKGTTLLTSHNRLLSLPESVPLEAMK